MVVAQEMKKEGKIPISTFFLNWRRQMFDSMKTILPNVVSRARFEFWFSGETKKEIVDGSRLNACRKDPVTKDIVDAYYKVLNSRRKIMEKGHMYATHRRIPGTEFFSQLEEAKTKIMGDKEVKEHLKRLGYTMSFVPVGQALKDKYMWDRRPIALKGREIFLNEELLYVRKEHVNGMVALIREKILSGAYLADKPIFRGSITTEDQFFGALTREVSEKRNPHVLELGPGKATATMLAVLNSGGNWTGVEIREAWSKFRGIWDNNFYGSRIDRLFEVLAERGLIKREEAGRENVKAIKEMIRQRAERDIHLLEYFREHTGIDPLPTLEYFPGFMRKVTEFYERRTGQKVERHDHPAFTRFWEAVGKLGMGYIAGDLGAPLFRENSFDIAVEHGMLQYSDVLRDGIQYFNGSNIFDVMLEMRKAIKPNGRFIGAYPLIDLFFEPTETPGVYVNRK